VVNKDVHKQTVVAGARCAFVDVDLARDAGEALQTRAAVARRVTGRTDHRRTDTGVMTRAVLQTEYNDSSSVQMPYVRRRLTNCLG